MAATEEYGVFFAILPAQPTISPDELVAACQTVASEFDLLIWTHHRESALQHPALQEPLQFIEISGKLSLTSRKDSSSSTDSRNVETICGTITAALQESAPTIIGNAELLLVLENTPIPLLPSKVPMDGTVTTFDKYGLVGMKDVIDDLDLDGLYRLATETFASFYELLQHKSTKHFKEIMQRDANRFDFRLDLIDDQWKEYENKGRWKQLVAQALGDDYSIIKCGCVLSLPGAGMQYYHSDGVHVGSAASFDSDDAAETHALCVFVPLIDLNHEVGFTEFWAGSHRYNRLLDKKGEQALPGGTDGILEKGDCLLYDYRTIHRGTSNQSNVTRPVCYFLYSRKGMEDVEDQNFTSDSLFD
jgi:ectoine hydroxylase-related dioxygenase (phytanoyl-CoA dioxygenase family)